MTRTAPSTVGRLDNTTDRLLYRDEATAPTTVV